LVFIDELSHDARNTKYKTKNVIDKLTKPTGAKPDTGPTD
jgi:hypothetical protein